MHGIRFVGDESTNREGQRAERFVLIEVSGSIFIWQRGKRPQDSNKPQQIFDIFSRVHLWELEFTFYEKARQYIPTQPHPSTFFLLGYIRKIVTNILRNMTYFPSLNAPHSELIYGPIGVFSLAGAVDPIPAVAVVLAGAVGVADGEAETPFLSSANLHINLNEFGR